MTTQPDNKLMPCPFCGEAPDYKEWEMINKIEVRIFCDVSGCCAARMEGEKAATIDNWNTRAQTSQASVWRDKLDEVGIARAIYAERNGDTSYLAWRKSDPQSKMAYLRDARAVIAYLKPPEAKDDSQ